MPQLEPAARVPQPTVTAFHIMFLLLPSGQCETSVTLPLSKATVAPLERESRIALWKGIKLSGRPSERIAKNAVLYRRVLQLDAQRERFRSIPFVAVS